MKNFTRKAGLDLQMAGCIIIITVMLADRFLWTVNDRFILLCAFISAALIIAGMQIVKRRDQEAELLADHNK